MSEDMDKVCRAMLLQVKVAKTLDDAIFALETIAGAAVTAEVNDKIAQRQKTEKEKA